MRNKYGIMRKRILYMAVSALFAAGAAAQTEDGSLNREMTIEKDFTPLVRDASKINLLPAVEPTAPRRTNVQFSDWTVPVVPSPVLQPLPAAVPVSDEPFYRKRGYADIALGNYWNASASAGYRFLDNGKDRLNVWFRHLSTHGKVGFADGAGRTHQRRSDNLLHAGYRHLFDRVIWILEGDYRFDTFNYYGRVTAPAADAAPDRNRMQEVHQYGARTEFVSPKEPAREWYYRLSAGYHRYQNRMGLWYGEKGVAENLTDVCFELNAPITESQGIALEGRLDNLIYDNRCGAAYRASCPDNYSMVSLNPYYRMERDRLKLHAGATVQLSFHNGALVRLAPDVRLSWEFVRRFFLYSDVLGGKTLHTFASLSNGNGYIDPSQLPHNSYAPVDWKAGLRANVLNCLWADLSGGIQCVEGDLFDFSPAGGLYDDAGRVTAPVRPVAGYINRDAFVWHVGGEVKYTYDKKVDVSVAWRHEIRKTEALNGTGRTALKSGRPADRLTVRAEATPMPSLSLYADYFMGLGRGVLLGTETGLVPVPLRDIHELGAGALYRICDAVHLRVRFDNILNRRYSVYYGMPAQGFRFMAGAGVNF